MNKKREAFFVSLFSRLKSISFFRNVLKFGLIYVGCMVISCSGSISKLFRTNSRLNFRREAAEPFSRVLLGLFEPRDSFGNQGHRLENLGLRVGNLFRCGDYMFDFCPNRAGIAIFADCALFFGGSEAQISRQSRECGERQGYRRDKYGCVHFILLLC